jgi:membrane protein YdbS with pleckstrin-like domain
LLLRFLVGKPASSPESIGDRQAEWQSFLDALPPTGPLGGALGDLLFERFLWADNMATQLGRLYRSAYVLNFLLAACAVFVGLLSVLDAWNDLFGGIAAAKTFCVVAELALIAVVIGITAAGRHARWHERFLNARALAELLRHMRVLAPIGRVGRVFASRGSSAEIDDNWTIWYARAALRELPMPNARAEAGFLRGTISAVVTYEVEGQIKYHHANHQSLETAHHRLDKAGETLFRTAVFLCLLWLVLVAIFGFHGVDENPWISHTLKSVLTFLGAVLPAFAGALAGIRAQGDFRASAKQSLSTELELKNLLHRVSPRMPETYPAAFAILEAFADSMASELAKWRLMFRHRPLAMPG